MEGGMHLPRVARAQPPRTPAARKRRLRAAGASGLLRRSRARPLMAEGSVRTCERRCIVKLWIIIADSSVARIFSTYGPEAPCGSPPAANAGLSLTAAAVTRMYANGAWHWTSARSDRANRPRAHQMRALAVPDHFDRAVGPCGNGGRHAAE